MREAILVLLFTFLASVLGGCATTAGYQTVMDTWIGAKEEALYMSWGAPSSVFQMGTKKIVVYDSIGDPAMTQFGTSFGNIYIPSRNSCKTEFFVGDFKTIESYKFQGNSCKAKVRRQTQSPNALSSNK